MTDDEQELFNKSIGKLEEEIIALKKEYQAECNRADELEDSLQKSWRNESKLKELLKECKAHLTLGEFGTSVTPLNILLDEIDNAIGEKK